MKAPRRAPGHACRSIAAAIGAWLALGACVSVGAQPVGTSSAAASGAEPAPVPSDNAAAPAVRIHTDAVTGVKYLNGGVGDDEQQAIKAASSVYPFDVVFSRKDGAYAVVDKVTVRDRNRTVLAVAQAGPMLLAKLPPGKYAVEAIVDGKPQQRTIEVTKGTHRVVAWILD